MKKIIFFRIVSLSLVLLMTILTPVTTYAVPKFYHDIETDSSSITVSDKIVNIAKAEIGFYEGDINKFTTWYYGRETESSWCCIFVSWCASQAGVLDSAIPQRASCESMRNWFKLRNQYYPVDSYYVPVKGDIVFYNTECDGTDDIHHVEIVTEDGYKLIKNTIGVKSVGGNTSNMNYQGCQYVMEKFRPIDGPRAQIVGFCHPSYQKADGLMGMIYSYSDQNRSEDMRFIHSKYISLLCRIEEFLCKIFYSVDSILLY